MIIEQITGETLEDFARRRIFDPLGMEDTHWFLPVSKRGRYVTRDPSYRGGAWMSSEEATANMSASGGLKSTMPDLTRVYAFILRYSSARRGITSNRSPTMP
jgi:CubicO group peptidase (beta-lactamase class C family)